jgi:4-amino-4-deoxy-L-arabinose transferase-like glycosyltransferase
MFGRVSALTALFLYSFSPNAIAHSHLVTMDLALACFMFVTLYHLWRFVRGGRSGDLVGAGIGLGLALASKFSAVLLLPLVALLLGLATLRPARTGAPRVGRAALAYGAILLIAAGVVYASYQLPTDPLFFVRGLLRVQADHRPDYAAFLLGDFRVGGWWYYLLIASVIKTPLPTLIGVGLALTFLRSHPAGDWLDEAFVILPAVGFTAFTCALADNLGLRYLFPVYPLVFLFVARLGLAFARSRVWLAVAVLLGGWYVGSAAYIHPEHLSYFNELVGGPGRGHLYLDDSNIDWGGGLKKLGAYLDREGIERIHLRYGWNGSPEYYGIEFDPVTDEEWVLPPAPGIHVFSTHVLVRGEHHARRFDVPTDWLSRYEPVDRIGYEFYVFEFE